MLVVGLGKLNDDSYYKYHPYDGWVGWAIVVIRVILYLYFILNIRDTFSRAR